jgi:2-amino-4-hydroxy-6-hydroxymethyldihydropteridine diphosphokinase
MDETSPTQWLLVLGSNADADAQLDRALAALADMGEIVATSERLAGEDVSGGARVYLNQLVELRMRGDAADLVQLLKAVEREQGRNAERMASGLCDLDIDLLARLDDVGQPQWLAQKPRQIPAVQTLLIARFGG